VDDLPDGPLLVEREGEPHLGAVYGRSFAATRFRAMELITILNRCHRFRGFVYQQAHFSADKKCIEVAVRPRKGSAAVCSRCHFAAPGYDQLAERRFEFIPFCGARLPSVHLTMFTSLQPSYRFYGEITFSR
jgi:hypothetical protein